MITSSGQTVRLISVDILTPSYRIVGQVAVNNTGLIGLLNTSTTSFLEVTEATTARIHMPSKAVGQHKLVRLVKDQIFVVSVPRREYLGPIALQRGGFTTINEYPVMLTTAIYEAEGTLEWAGRFDFAAVMVEGTRDFVPLLNARVRTIILPNFFLEAPALLFNRKQICTLALQ